MRRAFLYLLLLQLVDYVTTAHVVARQGFDMEANQWLLHLMRISGTPYAILGFKLFAFTIYAGAMYALYIFQPERFARPIWRWVVYLFNIAYTVVVLRTIYIIVITL